MKSRVMFLVFEVLEEGLASESVCLQSSSREASDRSKQHVRQVGVLTPLQANSTTALQPSL